MELFKLYGTIFIDNKQALKELGITTKEAKKSQQAFDKIGAGIAKFGAAAGAAIGAAATGLTALALKVADTGGAIADASKKVGMSAEDLQKWQYAAKQSGMDTDKLTSLMVKQQSVFADAKNGAKGASQAYSELGIDITKVGSSSEAFDLVVKRLAGMTDETQRNRLAQDIFGKSYADLLPLMAEGGAGIDALKQKASDLGLVMSNENVKAADDFGDTIDTLKGAIDGIVNNIVASFLPTFQKVADWFIDNKETILGFVQGALDVAVASFKWLADNANWLIPILVGVVAGFAAFQIISFVSGLIATFTALTTGATTVMGIFNAVMAANPIGMIALAIGALIGVIALLWANWDKITKWMGTAFKGFGNGVIGVVNVVIKALNQMIEWALIPVNALIKGWNNTIGKVTGKIPQIKIEIPLIPKLAKGGLAFGETMATVGEYPGAKSNPEVISPLSDLQDILAKSQPQFNEESLARAVKNALKGFGVILDGEKVGEFVDMRLLKGV